MMGPEERVRKFLADNGADIVGFTPAGWYGDWDEVFRARLCDAKMPSHYAGTLSADPFQLLPGAKSIVVFGMKYEGLSEVTDPGRGSIAGIAWARKKARGLSALLEGFLLESGFGARDVMSFPMKAAAVGAGIAVQRKNSLACFESGGSAVRIGTVLTDLELEPGRPIEAEPCGGCTLCLDACPTGALCAEYVVDAPRCLCYVLEHDSGLPPEMRPVLGNRLVGCETCQVVCPLNREVPRLTLEDVPWLDLLILAGEAARRPERLIARLRDDLALPVYSDYTPLRSIAIALGNRGDDRAAGFLRELSRSKCREVAEAARWSLETLGES